MKVNYIIVGCGLAGIAFCEQLRAHKKSFIVFDNQSQQSSYVAAGMYNPVILKRFSEVWKSRDQLKLANPFYKTLEHLLQVKLDYKLKIYRRFASVEEQNTWFTATDNPNLEPFLSSKLITNTNKFIDAPFSFGEVLEGGRIDTIQLITSYKKYLKSNDQLRNVPFFYEQLEVSGESVNYQDIIADKMVFCEGFGLKQNPFFNYLPLNGTKGELITIKAPDLKIDYALKSSVFVIPEGDDLYSVGATYNWVDKTNMPTSNGKEELIQKLKQFLKCDFEVVNHVAGIRPTVKDRRPLVGNHPSHKNLYLINGLGTRGVMIAPYVAKALFNTIENGMALSSEIAINRFIS